MANRESRIKKLEEKSIGGRRLVYPYGYYYGEPDCEPYETDAPIRAGMDAYYEAIAKEKEEITKRKADQKLGQIVTEF